MSRIAAKFAALKAEGRGALIPFLEAGDPDRETSLALLRGDQTGRQLVTRAQMTRRAGRDAMRAAWLNTATSLMSSYGNYAKASGTARVLPLT